MQPAILVGASAIFILVGAALVIRARRIADFFAQRRAIRSEINGRAMFWRVWGSLLIFGGALVVGMVLFLWPR